MLTAKMHKAAYLLYQDELTDEQVAKEVGVSRKTLSLWKQKPEFADELTGMSTKQRERAYTVLESNSELAANTLVELARTGADHVRLKASLELLRMTRVDVPANEVRDDTVGIAFSQLIKSLQV